MALRDTINKLFGRNQPAVADTSSELSAVSSQRSAQSYSSIAEKFRSETERANIIKQCRLMYKTDPRVEKMLTTLARDTLGNGFVVKVNNASSPVSASKAQDEADALQSRLSLNQKLERYVRRSGRDGDSFLQGGVAEDLNITSFTRKPTLNVHRNSNNADLFGDPSRAFWMADTMFGGTEAPKDAIWFAEWEMVHARWQWDEESRYGTPMMGSSTGAFKRVTEGEIDVSVRRKTRAGMRYHHVVEGSAADVEAYKEINKAALDNPLSAQADFFSNKPGGITAISGDAHLSEIEDVRHHIATMFTGGDVPMELIAYGEGLNRDILGEKKAEYGEILRQAREGVSDEIIKPLFERQWLLKGIMPEGLKYKIEWRRTSSLTAQDIQAITSAAVQMRLLGVPEEAIQAVLANYLPGVDAEMLLPQRAAGDTGRFADMVKGISV